MTFKDLWTSLKTTWHSRPLALILPVVALAVFWWTHGHTWTRASLPTYGEWVAGTTLLLTQFGRVLAVFVGEADPATLPPPVVQPLLKPPTDATKGAALVLLLAAGLTGAGVAACGTTSTGPTSTAITIAKECADQATHTAAINLIPDVANALASDSWTSALTDLVTRFGIAAIDCAVQEVAGEANHDYQASKDSLAGVKAQRGRQWLAAHPIPVATP